MQWCRRCVQPDTRPGIQFDAEGVCPACRFADEHREIDWGARKEQLKEIAAWGHERNVSGYDCIIGVSGGKDSVRQACFVRDELNLKPLLVSNTYPPEQQTERGAHNLANLISLGFDCVSSSPAPRTWKRLMREGFLRYGNWARSTEMALYASAPRFAIAYHIPLMFLGESPAIMLGDLDVGVTGSANRMKYCHTLGGGDPTPLLPDGVVQKDVMQYFYPTDDEMEWADLQIYYLGYYLPDFTRFSNAEFAQARGLIIRDDPPEDIGDAWGFEALDDDFVVVNQMMKYIKFGFGKVVDQASEGIRFGTLSRDAAIDLVHRYDGKCAPRFIERFCQYLEISEEQFWGVVERFRNHDIWERDTNGAWRLRSPIQGEEAFSASGPRHAPAVR